MSDEARASDPLRLLTCAEAAKILRVRETAVRELVETGQLRALRIGSRYRIPFGALAALGEPGVSQAPVATRVRRVK